METKLSRELPSLARLSLWRVYTTSKFSLSEIYEGVSRENGSESSRASIHTGEWRNQLTTSECPGNMSQKCKAADALLVLKEVKIKRSVLVRDWISRRGEDGAHAKLLQKLFEEDDQAI